MSHIVVDPEYKDIASEHSDTVTIRDLLHMSSGKKVFYFSGDEEEMKTNDWAKLFFSDPMKCGAGEQFFYSNACTYMLSRIVEKVSGVTLRDFLVPRLFSPLGIFNPQWHTCTANCEFDAGESTNGYGYQLWLCSYKGTYRADGMYGQFCIVIPDKEAVITVTSHEENKPNEFYALYTKILCLILINFQIVINIISI